MKKSYSDIVAEAERAVSVVKDAELRRVAFEKILDDLIQSERGPNQRPTDSTGLPDTSAAGMGSEKRVGKSKGATNTRIPRKGVSAYIQDLIDEGLFTKPRTISEIKAELGNRGHHIPLTSLSGPLQRLCQSKVLRRQKTQGGDDQKKGFAYSVW